jgi:hypothetical protein
VQLVALALAVVLSAFGAPIQAPARQRVLFIGNSLTYANDLPGLVQSLSKSAGFDVMCRAVAFPDYSLEDHWTRGDALKAIREGGWSLVILQQGPSALPESQVLLREFTKRFDAEIRRAGARTALYMVWPSRARSQDFDAVSRSYTNAAADVGGILIPAGDAWRAAWKRDQSLALYSADGLHPSPAGTYLAALVILKRAFGIPPARVTSPGIDSSVWRLLQQAAADVAAPTSDGGLKPADY